MTTESLLTQPLPWQNALWARLTSQRTQRPHALMLYGPRGMGKRSFGLAFAASLLCRQPAPNGGACGVCSACNWFARGNHPDFRLIQPEADEVIDPTGETPSTPAASSRKASRLIRIEQARALQEWLSVGAHQGGLRVALLYPADAMNLATANSLLKTLEEPPPGTLILLITHNAEHLLPTVRSRCQALPTPIPARAQALQWLTANGVADADEALALAGGAPLTASDRPELVALARTLVADLAAPDQDAVALGARYQTQVLADVIDLLQKWVFDLAAGAGGLGSRYFPQAASDIARARRGIDLNHLIAYSRRLGRARELADHPLAIRLVLEELFIEYARLRTP